MQDVGCIGSRMQDTRCRMQIDAKGFNKYCMQSINIESVILNIVSMIQNVVFMIQNVVFMIHNTDP